MPDMITGVLVLQRMGEGTWGLWFQYTRHDGLVGYTYIPVKPKGAEKRQEGPVWDFVMENPTLHVSPSVRILGPKEGDPDHFHNAGQWSNPFVIMQGTYGSEPDASEVCRKINEFKTKEECDRVILDYRVKGILE